MPISCYPLSCISIAYALLVLNIISWYCVLHVFGHLINHIFQFTSELCLTNQSCSRNMFVPFKSVTTMSICSLCLLISTLSSTNHVNSLFFVPFVLKTSNTMSASFVLICSSLTNCLLISIYVYLESTSICSCNYFPVYIFTFDFIFSSLSLLFC